MAFLGADAVTWRPMPAPYTYAGQSVFVRDVGVAGSVWRSNGTAGKY